MEISFLSFLYLKAGNSYVSGLSGYFPFRFIVSCLFVFPFIITFLQLFLPLPLLMHLTPPQLIQKNGKQEKTKTKELLSFLFSMLSCTISTSLLHSFQQQTRPDHLKMIT